MQIDTSRDRAEIKAVLGPTNTGKTHLAMERMLAHQSGVIGFPLRLLARENYDRAVKAKGASLVALVTGEEKIVPPGARYFLTTVESMPTGQAFEFVAIDEIQMCADPDRGHIFTDRLLNTRGTRETMFLGADTIRPLIQALVPGVEFISRPRLSTLRYQGARKLTKLKARSAIVAFSANDVYSIAELIRRTSGGAAIVMGALSPRTRNAQVEMFQSGEVDYLVATDAVGMGLNMDVDHVALAATRKFDGRMLRNLTSAELAQIAGRAGRHMNDGSFGVTGDVPGLPQQMVEQIENHSFPPLTFLQWRNSALDFASVKALKSSLEQRPDHDALRRCREADDELFLARLSEEREVAERANTRDNVSLLWDVCRIPDFKKIQTDEHPQLLSRIYGHLTSSPARIPTDWIDAQVKRVSSSEGDIEALMARIAGVRIWTFVSHQAGWLDDAEHWQGRTREIEDRLSDALHQRLTQRFVDQRTSQLARRLKADAPLEAALGLDGSLEVEGHHVGHLNGFRFAAAESETTLAAKVLDSAAGKVLRERIAERVQLLEHDADGAFSFTPEARVLWRGEPVAKLEKGAERLNPDVKALSSDLLEAEQKERIEARLKLWLADLIRERLGPLVTAREAPLHGAAKGLVYQLTESLGALPRFDAKDAIAALEKDDRRALRQLGIRIGRHLIYIPALLKPAAVELSVLLWALWDGAGAMAPPPAGRVSIKREAHEPEGWLRAAGFRPAGALFVRADMLERMAELAWTKLEAAKGPFEAGEDFLSLAGCTVEELAGILKSLGFSADAEGKFSPRKRGPKRSNPQQGRQQDKPATGEDAPKRRPKGPKPSGGKPRGPKGSGKPRPPKAPAYDPDSPFAKLKELKLK